MLWLLYFACCGFGGRSGGPVLTVITVIIVVVCVAGAIDVSSATKVITSHFFLQLQLSCCYALHEVLTITTPCLLEAGSHASSVESWLESVTRDREGSRPLGPWGH